MGYHNNFRFLKHPRIQDIDGSFFEKFGSLFARDAEANDVRLAPFPKTNDGLPNANSAGSLAQCSAADFATVEASGSSALLQAIPESDSVSDISPTQDSDSSSGSEDGALRSNEVADAVFDGMIGDIMMNVSI